MPSNRKSETVQKHTIPSGEIDTKLAGPDQTPVLCGTEFCQADIL